jgi:secreted Zn-dependent insulinase-like peptidase
MHSISSGTQQGLSQVTRETMLAFFNKYYSADLMKLVLLAARPLDELETLARKHFAGLPRRNTARPRFASQIFAPQLLPREIRMKTAKEHQTLSLIFNLPGNPWQKWKSKPLNILSQLLNSRVKNSLLYYLKEQGYISTLNASAMDSSTFNVFFWVDFSLTEKGWRQYREVIGYFFAYVNMLRQNPLPIGFFDEIGHMAQLNVQYADFSGGMASASSLAQLMQLFEPAQFARANLFFEYEPQKFSALLKEIIPQKLNAFLIGNELQTERIEPEFQTPYGVSPYDAAAVKSWETASQPAFGYPPPNPFVPSIKPFKLPGQRTEPQKIIDQPLIRFYHQQNDRFYQPKTYLKLHFLNPWAKNTLANDALSRLYAKAIGYQLAELEAMGTWAGLHSSLSIDHSGIFLAFFGYSEHLLDYAQRIIERLKLPMELSPSQLEDIKKYILRNLANMRQESPDGQANDALSSLLSPSGFAPEEVAAELVQATRESLQAYASQLFRPAKLRGVSYGTLGEEQVRQFVQKLPSLLAMEGLGKKKEPRWGKILLDKAYGKVLHVAANNACWLKALQLGPVTPELDAALQLGSAYLSMDFFNVLRTQQQVGYVVSLAPLASDNILYLIFSVLSDKRSAVDIAKLAKNWEASALKQLAQMSEQEFRIYQEQVAKSSRVEGNTMAEAFDTLWFEMIGLKGQRGYREKVAAAAEKLDKPSLVTLLSQAFGQNRSLSIYVTKPAQPLPGPLSPEEQLITEDKQFKSSMPLWPHEE